MRASFYFDFFNSDHPQNHQKVVLIAKPNYIKISC